ncbi:MAG: Rrf2 family transcriptional regulator [Bacteroidaceae bacterium]|nr:Rrf2 family transcriptional regulator [Bacteroidaceae bacterium]
MFSRKTRYAIMALTILAREYGRSAVPMSRISDEQNVPIRFLEGIFLQLRNEGMLVSERGVSGGYRLARPPQEIKVLDVILAMREKVGMISCLDICGNSFECEFGLNREKCRIRDMFGDIQKSIYDNLSSRTLVDFV